MVWRPRLWGLRLRHCMACCAASISRATESRHGNKSMPKVNVLVPGFVKSTCQCQKHLTFDSKHDHMEPLRCGRAAYPSHTTAWARGRALIVRCACARRRDERIGLNSHVSRSAISHARQTAGIRMARTARLALWRSHCQAGIGLQRPIPYYQNVLFSVARGSIDLLDFGCG